MALSCLPTPDRCSVRHSGSQGSPRIRVHATSPRRSPEEPTRPLPPATPPPARVGVEREVAAPVEDPYRTELLLDQLRSLRSALAIVGLIAVAALAVAVYAVLTRDEVSDAGAGASSQQVADLDDRVDALEADVKTRATKNQVSQLSDDVKALSERSPSRATRSPSCRSPRPRATTAGRMSRLARRSTSSSRVCRRSARTSKTSTGACRISRTRPSSNSPEALRRPREAAAPSNRPVDDHSRGTRRCHNSGRRGARSRSVSFASVPRRSHSAVVSCVAFERSVAKTRSRCCATPRSKISTLTS